MLNQEVKCLAVVIRFQLLDLWIQWCFLRSLAMCHYTMYLFFNTGRENQSGNITCTVQQCESSLSML